MDEYLRLNPKPSNLLWDCRRASTFGSENELTPFIKEAFTDILSCFPKFDHLAESSLQSFKLDTGDYAVGCSADSWITQTIDSMKHPLCTIEVKLPPSATGDLHNTILPESVYGQVLDYILILRRNFGVRAPFGFITTYYTWWICWLPDCDAVAGASSMTTFAPSPTVHTERKLHGTILRLPEPFDASDLTMEQLQEKRAQVLTFCLQIGSAISKCIDHGVDDLSDSLDYSPLRKLVCFKENTIEWKYLNKPKEIKDQMPTPQTKNFFRLGHLGENATSRMRRVCDANGHRCALKFAAKHDVGAPELAFVEEMSLWKRVNKVEKVFIVKKLGGSYPALIMPYLHPLAEEERKDSRIHEHVIKLFESCVEQNYHKTDSDWCHVGWYRYEEPHRLMLSGFGHMKKITNQEEALHEMLSAMCVCQKLGECSMCTYLRNRRTV